MSFILFHRNALKFCWSASDFPSHPEYRPESGMPVPDFKKLQGPVPSHSPPIKAAFRPGQRHHQHEASIRPCSLSLDDESIQLNVSQYQSPSRQTPHPGLVWPPIMPCMPGLTGKNPQLPPKSGDNSSGSIPSLKDSIGCLKAAYIS